jgi:hypothetical protein
MCGKLQRLYGMVENDPFYFRLEGGGIAVSDGRTACTTTVGQW